MVKLKSSIADCNPIYDVLLFRNLESGYLDLAKLWYNTSYNSAIDMSPFQAFYGRAAPSLEDYTKGNSNNKTSMIISSVLSRKHYERHDNAWPTKLTNTRQKRNFRWGNGYFLSFNNIDKYMCKPLLRTVSNHGKNRNSGVPLEVTGWSKNTPGVTRFITSHSSGTLDFETV